MYYIVSDYGHGDRGISEVMTEQKVLKEYNNITSGDYTEIEDILNADHPIFTVISDVDLGYYV